MIQGKDPASKSNSATVIVVVAKAPQVGQVKTRLCPPLTYEGAARLYTGFLLDTLALAASAPGCDLKIVCPSRQDAIELRRLLSQEAPELDIGYIVQSGAGLTDALSRSFSDSLAAGYEKVLCISSDNPTLPPAYLIQAVKALDATRLVFGPSEDGGYYLIGARQLYPALFDGMVWSTSTVLAETLERASQLNLTCHLLPPWYDLDTGQDLARFIESLRQANGVAETPAYHTRLALLAAYPAAKFGSQRKF